MTDAQLEKMWKDGRASGSNVEESSTAPLKSPAPEFQGQRSSSGWKNGKLYGQITFLGTGGLVSRKSQSRIQKQRLNRAISSHFGGGDINKKRAIQKALAEFIQDEEVWFHFGLGIVSKDCVTVYFVSRNVVNVHFGFAFHISLTIRRSKRI